MQVTYFSEAKIEEADNAIKNYGCAWEENPEYVIVGTIKDDRKRATVGVLAFVNNYIHACLLQKILSKYGAVNVHYTEHSDKCDFNIGTWNHIVSTYSPEELVALLAKESTKSD
jgi:hypothetical protein